MTDKTKKDMTSFLQHIVEMRLFDLTKTILYSVNIKDKISYTSLSDEQKKQIIDYLFEIEEYNVLSSGNFRYKDFSPEQQIEICKHAKYGNLQYHIRKIQIDDEIAKEICRKNRSQYVRWGLAANKSISFKFRNKLITDSMLRKLMKRYRYKNQEDLCINEIRKILPADVRKDVINRVKKLYMIKNIIQ